MRYKLAVVSISVLVIVLIAIPLWLGAQPGGKGGPPPDQGKPPQPPQEAINACSEKSANAACEFSSPRGDKMTGTCEKERDQLACRPIPKEAIAACTEKSEGATCEFSSPRGDKMTGTCQKKPEQLACVLKEPPKREGKPGEAPSGEQKTQSK